MVHAILHIADFVLDGHLFNQSKRLFSLCTSLGALFLYWSDVMLSLP